MHTLRRKIKMTFVPIDIRNERFTLKKAKAIIFDLDDTLYSIPTGAQFHRYGEHLSLYLPEKERKAYLKELERSWNDGSPVKVGRAFDGETNWILEFDDHWRIKRAYLMDGSVVAKEKLRKIYKTGTVADELNSLIYLSSGWGIPSALGRLHGLGREQFRAAYLATRKDMRENPEAFPLVVPSDFPKFFEKLYDGEYSLIVMTNSDLHDAEDVLEKLRIRACIHKIYAEARKPNHSIPILREILKNSGLQPVNLLVVGDSVYNDLREAKSIGAQTILIERFPNQPLGMVDVRVWDFEGFMQLFK